MVDEEPSFKLLLSRVVVPELPATPAICIFVPLNVVVPATPFEGFTTIDPLSVPFTVNRDVPI